MWISTNVNIYKLQNKHSTCSIPATTFTTDFLSLFWQLLSPFHYYHHSCFSFVRYRVLILSIFSVLLCANFLGHGAFMKWYWQGKTDVLGEKPVPFSRCPSQIPHTHTLAWDRTQASALRDQRLTAFLKAEMSFYFYVANYKVLHVEWTKYKYIFTRVNLYFIFPPFFYMVKGPAADATDAPQL
jgi:hypothetical protein